MVSPLKTSTSSALILSGATKSRFLDNSRNKPSLLEEKGGELLISWLLKGLEGSNFLNVNISCEYHLEKLVSLFPDFNYFYPNKNHTQSTSSLIYAGRDSLKSGGLIIDSGIILREDAIDSISKLDQDVVIGFEPIKSDRNKSNAKLAIKHGKVCLPEVKNSVPIYFSGVIKIKQSIVGDFFSVIESLIHQKDSSDIEDIISSLLKKGIKINAVDITSNWAKIYRPKALANFILGTKAETLERLYGNIKTAKVLPQVRFSVKDWYQKKDKVLSKISEEINSNYIVIRSSSLSEDSFSTSNAGSFKSLLAVPKKDSAIEDGIEEVIESYGRKDSSISLEDQILIQPFLDNISLSGVILTSDQTTKSPYNIINYEKDSGTDGVTSGTGKNVITEIVIKNLKKHHDKDIQGLIKLSQELSELLALDFLDIEFAIDKKGTLYLLQVRPLITKNEDPDYTEEDFYSEISNAKEFVKNLQVSSYGVYGKKTILANMPDWNPAEIIGNRPRPLAFSLYQKLITDGVWAKARHEAGYIDFQGNPLMHKVAGHPFIDVRASFNSFLPLDLGDLLSERLINFYLDRLERFPELHDKVEFEIVPTCLDFNFNKFKILLEEAGFLEREIKELKNSLKNLTENIIGQTSVNMSRERDNIFKLEEFRKKQNETLTEKDHLPLAIHKLCSKISSNGTLPFSKFARNGFIALSFLRSMVVREVISEDELDLMLQSIPTVATDFTKKVSLLNRGEIKLDIFLEEFGHLRPGTYDILSLNYKENAENYFLNKGSNDQIIEHADETLNFVDRLFKSKEIEIKELIEENKFNFSVEDLKVFIKEAIPAREYSKFVFTKSLDQVFTYIKKWGNTIGISIDDLSYISIEKILKLSSSSDSAALNNELLREINFQKKYHNLIKAIRVPDVISSASNIDSFTFRIQQPNFVTNNNIEARLEVIDKKSEFNSLDGAIVLIENADPGYDWIFSHNISGLITKYGGAASHMAIRAGEFQLPAAIGCGESIFNQILGANFIKLDCANKTIIKIN